MPAPKGNNNAKGNIGGGRKSSYKKEYAEQAFKYCLLGAIDRQLAELFDVSEKTINTWKKRYIKFSSALKRGKAIADAEVANSLYKNATENNNVTAQIFWLKNRRPQDWRDKQNVTHDVDDSLTELLQAISDSNLVGPEHLRNV